MEELRSTEILDKEIQEDARRKAERILRKTDVECEKIKNSVSTRIETVTSEKNEEYKKRPKILRKMPFRPFLWKNNEGWFRSLTKMSIKP